MKNKAKKSRLVEISAWALSLMTFLATIGLWVLLDYIPFPGYISTEIGGVIIYVVFLTVACFLICRTHPKSVWYTPLICNALVIFLVIMDPDIWARIIMIGMIVLSVAGAIVGARIGRSRINQGK
jgi:CDP-diglyceride synthetase